MTFGERMVRTTFNPSASGSVDVLKQGAAMLIDELHKLRLDAFTDEAKRCYSIAITHLETAAMYAVKGATAPDAALRAD